MATIHWTEIPYNRSKWSASALIAELPSVAVEAGYLAEGTCSYHSAWYGVAAENGSATTEFWADSLGEMKEKVAEWAEYEIVRRQRQREQEQAALRSLSKIAPGARVGVGPRVPIIADSIIKDDGTIGMVDQFGNEIWFANGTTQRMIPIGDFLAEQTG